MDTREISKFCGSGGGETAFLRTTSAPPPPPQNLSDTKIIFFTNIPVDFAKSSRAAAPQNFEKAATPTPSTPKNFEKLEKKLITTTKKWLNIKPEDLTHERQYELLLLAQNFYNTDTKATAPPPQHYKLIIEHIKQKLHSYKSQDQIKNKYCAEEFVDIPRVFELLVSCNMECHYCKKHVMLLYEYVREPIQWSLDRIDNSIGHTRNNLFIACLKCNLRRRCIKPERYELTKKCTNIIRIGAGGGTAAPPHFTTSSTPQNFDFTTPSAPQNFDFTTPSAPQNFDKDVNIL